MIPMATVFGFMKDQQISLEFQSFYAMLLLFMLLVFSIWMISFKKSNKINLPPSPSKLPIIGNLHQLSPLPHHDLQKLAQKHGPVMIIHMGYSPTLVVSSSETAREIMKTQDHIFCNRPNSVIANRFTYDCKSLALAPYGEYWRKMRNICMHELLSGKKVQSFRPVREEEIEVMIRKISISADNEQVVDLSQTIMTLTSDIICRVAFGKKYFGEENGKKLGEFLIEMFYLLGDFNIGNFIPWLSWVNHINGLNARVEKCFQEMDSFLEKVIEDHIVNKKKRDEVGAGDEHHEYKEDLVDILLGINGGSIGKNSLKAIIMDMFGAGTNTTSSALKWVMAELMKNLDVMKKAQDEVREILEGKMKITDDDLNKMCYLKCIIKETLRMHPPSPLLVPRESTNATKIHGYDIPAKTTVFVNAYAIGRDPEIWKEPNKFEPGRFMDSSVDFKGHDFELIPFGAGRRGCPGITFVSATLELALANLLLRFDWKLAGDGNGADIDMSEASGIVVHRKLPLLVVATCYN